MSMRATKQKNRKPVKFPEKAFYQNLGATIREYRYAAGMSQEALAEEVGLTRQSVNNIEYARQRVLAHTLHRFAVALRIPAEALILGVAV